MDRVASFGVGGREGTHNFFGISALHQENINLAQNQRTNSTNNNNQCQLYTESALKLKFQRFDISAYKKYIKSAASTMRILVYLNQEDTGTTAKNTYSL